jgi:hypothetical protein
MAVNDFNVFRGAVRPHKAKAPLIVDADAVLPFPIAVALFQPVPGRAMRPGT